MDANIIEYDKLQNNNIIKNNIDTESFMINKSDQLKEIVKYDNDMKIVIRYPEYSEKDEIIKDEVRAILLSALQEQIKGIL